jgi:hypothetical protein
MELDSILLTHRLHIDSHYEEFVELYCNTTGANTSKTAARFVLSNWYEGYLYAVLLGLKINAREPRIGERKDKAPMWSKSYLSQYKYAITNVLSRKDVLFELNLLSREAISTHFVSVEATLNQVKSICEEYCSGGLKYLYTEWQKDPTVFNEYNALKKIYLAAKQK